MNEEELMEQYNERFNDCFPSMELRGVVDPIEGMRRCLEEDKSAEEIYGPFEEEDVEY